jgi:hypothetical protein
MIWKIDSTRMGESPIDGSSRSSTVGRAISARPIASICCSPPESVPPFWASRSSSRGNSVRTRPRSCRIPSRSVRAKAPRSRFSATLMRGKMRRPSGDCEMPSRTLWSVGTDSMRWPLKVMLPLRGRRVPMIVLSVVVFPAPLEPISVTISPRSTPSAMPLRARILP